MIILSIQMCENLQPQEDFPNTNLNSLATFSTKFISILNNNDEYQRQTTKQATKELFFARDKRTNQLATILINLNNTIGQSRKSKLNGYMSVTYQDGTVFKGLYINGNKTQGVIHFKDGSKYQGKFKDNLFNGSGIYFHSNGKKIEGNWLNCMPIGNMKVTYLNGEYYIGQLLDFKKHGKGTLHLPSGAKYVGEFKEGHIEGQGVYYPRKGKIQSGLWIKGRLIKSN